MAENLRTRQVTYIARFWISLHRKSTAYDHITEKVPVLVRSPQSNPEPRARLVPGWETAWEYPVL